MASTNNPPAQPAVPQQPAVQTTQQPAQPVGPPMVQQTPHVIPQQEGMPAPIVPKTVGGVLFVNDRVTPGSTPLVPDAAAAEQQRLAAQRGEGGAPASPVNTTANVQQPTPAQGGDPSKPVDQSKK